MKPARQRTLRSNARRRSTVTAAAVERLELRRLLTAAPAVAISGPSSVAEGSNYPLVLTGSNLTAPVDHWTVTWGDGQQSTAAGPATAADHVYADGPHAYAITATATLTNGITLTANRVGATITNAGQLDPAFASGGLLHSDTAAAARAEAIATFDNGQFVVAAYAGLGPSSTQVLRRFNPDGSPDLTFGTNGAVAVPGATAIVSVLDEHVADPNHPGYQVERLLVVGNVNSTDGYNCHSLLWRYDIGQSAYGLPDGSPDAAFGTRGVVTLPGVLRAAPYEGDNAGVAALAPTGQIVVIGDAWRGSGLYAGGQYLSFTRLNVDGSLDATFNGGQQYAVVAGFDGYNPGAVLAPLGVAVGADGSIVALTQGGVLTKMTNAAQLDGAFGTAGTATETPGQFPFYAHFSALTLDAGGNLILGGQLGTGSSFGWAIGRFSFSTGAIDATFGSADPGNTGGIAGVDGRIYSSNSRDGINALTALPNGQVAASLFQSPTFNFSDSMLAVGRFNADGTPDAAFAPGGIVRADFGSSVVSSTTAVAVQPDGKLLAGATYNPPSSFTPAWGVARLGQTVAGTVTPVSVTVANVAPTVVIQAGPGHVAEGSTVPISATVTDPSAVDTAAGVAVGWSVSRNGRPVASGTGTAFSFTPDDNAAYTVVVTATDRDGGVGSAVTTVTADNVAPTAVIATPITASVEGAVVSLSGTATDPSTADTSAGLSLTWAVTKNGLAFANGTGPGVSFTPDDNGAYVVTLSATDKDGGVGRTTDAIAVANLAPTPAIASPVTVGVEGTPVRLTGTATDAAAADMAAGLSLGWAVTKNGSPFVAGSGGAIGFTPDDNGTYVVTFFAADKDGGGASTADTIAVSNAPPTPALVLAAGPRTEGTAIALTGSATDPSAADVAAGIGLGWSVSKNGSPYVTGSGGTFAFTPDDDGTYAVTLAATDKDGGRASTTTTVTVANVAPTATIVAPVATGAEGATISLTGSAADPSAADAAAGLTLGWTVTKNGAAFGTGSGPAYTFAPDDNGTYVVTLRATDKDGGVGTTTDSIAVVNVAPVATFAVPIASAPEGSPLTLPGSATDAGPADVAAGLSLTWAVTKNNAPLASGTGGTPAFTPDDNGAYVVTLTATDKDGGVGMATDTITVTNVAPTITIPAPVTTGAEGAVVSMTGSAADPSTIDTTAGLATGWSVTKNGSPFASGNGGSVSFVPDDNGTYVVTLRATDKDGGVGTATDTVVVANVAPAPTLAAPSGTLYEGTPVALAASSVDPSPADTAAGVSYAWAVSKNGSAFASGVGASYTFTPDDNGAYAVTLSATDKDGGVGTVTRTLAVTNVAPSVTIPSPVTAAPEGSAITLATTVNDPGLADVAAGLTRTWAVSKNGNPFATGTGGSLTFTPDDNGAYVATFTVADKDGGTATATDPVAVSNVAPTPLIAAPVTTGYAGVAVTLVGSASDPSSVDAAAGTPLAWSVTKNGAAYGTAGSAGSYTFTPDAPGAYVITLRATDKDGGTTTTTDPVNVIPAGYRLSGSNLMYNGTVEQTGVTSYALRADGNAYYLTAAKAFGVNQSATNANTALGLVYSYGMRSDGYAYYWSQSDAKLYLNIPSQNIPVDNNAVAGFGMRSDGYGYFWEAASRMLYLNTPGFSVAIDNNPVAGFGLRGDGAGYFWDATTKLLQVNTPAANYQVGTNPVQGFGMRSDGSAFFWDGTTGNLFVNVVSTALTGTSIQLNATAVSAFTTDSSGNGYYVPVGTTNLRRDTVSTDTLVTPTYVPGTLKNAGPGPLSPVSYSYVNSGVVTPVTIPLA